MADDFSVGQRVQVHSHRDDTHYGVIVDDFGESAGHAVTIGKTRIAGPGRRWAVQLDDGRLLFADTGDLTRI